MVINIKRLCALTEESLRLPDEDQATREEVRVLASEVLRLRGVLHDLVHMCGVALRDCPVEGTDTL